MRRFLFAESVSKQRTSGDGPLLTGRDLIED